MKNFLALLQRRATGKRVLVLFAITTVVYLLMLGVTIPRVTVFAPNMQLFDLSIGGYSYNYAVVLLDTLGTQGRTLYMQEQLPLDFLYPILFAITYALMLVWLLKKRFQSDSPLFYTALIPVVAALFDYAENIAIYMMLISYPEISLSLVELASLFTVVKSVLTTLYFVLLFIAVCLLMIRKKRSNDVS